MDKPRHDHGYKALFSEPHMVKELIRGFIPGEWVKKLDFDTLEKANPQFVSRELLGRDDDLIWRVRLKQGGGWLYLFVMLEFQSKPDPWMALRIMVYVGLLWQDLIAQKQIKAGEKLPPVIPIVLYNGTDPWNAPVELEELVTKVRGLQAFRPRCRYLLLEEQKIELSGSEPSLNPVAALFRLEQSRTLDELRSGVEDLAKCLSSPEQAGLMRTFVAWMKQALVPARFPGIEVPDMSELSEVRAMLQERVKEWTQQWKAEGVAEGEAKGKQAMLRLIERRFGPLSPEQREQVEAADLEVLADRLLDVGSFEELIGS